MGRITAACFLLLCLIAAAVALTWFLSPGFFSYDCVVRYYAVHFEWSSRVHRLRVIDVQSGGEEINFHLRRVARQEAAVQVGKELKKAGLERAKGQFRMNLLGCEEPHLVSFLDFEIPDLSAFFSAAQTWDLKTIEKLIEGVDVNARDGMGRTALIWAAADPTRGISRELLARLTNRPDLGTVPFLLERGANPNAKDTQGMTALMRASGATVHLLLAAGADANTKDSRGRTALMHAAWSRDTETVKALLDFGVDPNARDLDGVSVLRYAKGRGRGDIVALLRKSGARD